MHVIIEMTGTTPLLMHHEQLSDPDNEIAKAIAVISSKKKKTEEDRSQMARLEWYGGIYIDSSGPHIPAKNVRKAFINAATVRRLGKAVTRSCIMRDIRFPLVYDGPREIDALWAAPRFRLKTPVGIGRNRIPRTRPHFAEWQLVADVELITDALDFDDFVDIVQSCGIMEGLGDGRAIGFGRFSAVVKPA